MTVATQEKSLSITDKAKLLRADLKGNGWNAKQISVSSSYAGYESCLKVRIKDLNIPLSKVEEIANQYSRIRYCKASGEILQGANTFVDVVFDYDAVNQKAAEYLELATNVFNKHYDKNDYSYSGSEIFRNDQFYILFWNRKQYEYFPSITLHKLQSYTANGETWTSGRQVSSYMAESPAQIATGLTYMFCQYIKR